MESELLPLLLVLCRRRLLVDLFPDRDLDRLTGDLDLLLGLTALAPPRLSGVLSRRGGVLRLTGEFLLPEPRSRSRSRSLSRARSRSISLFLSRSLLSLSSRPVLSALRSLSTFGGAGTDIATFTS